MKYIKPEIKISVFEAEDIITASGDANTVFNTYDADTTYTAVKAVDVSLAIQE